MQRWAQSSNNTCAVEVLHMVEAQSSFCHIALSCKEIAQILQVTAFGATLHVGASADSSLPRQTVLHTLQALYVSPSADRYSRCFLRGDSRTVGVSLWEETRAL